MSFCQKPCTFGSYLQIFTLIGNITKLDANTSKICMQNNERKKPYCHFTELISVSTRCASMSKR